MGLLAAAAVGTVCVLAAALLAQFVQGWGVRGVPGPARFPLLGSIPYLVRAPWTRVLHFTRHYGPIVKM